MDGNKLRYLGWDEMGMHFFSWDGMGMGMGMENPFPRQPCPYDIIIVYSVMIIARSAQNFVFWPPTSLKNAYLTTKFREGLRFRGGFNPPSSLPLGCAPGGVQCVERVNRWAQWEPSQKICPMYRGVQRTECPIWEVSLYNKRTKSHKNYAVCPRFKLTAMLTSSPWKANRNYSRTGTTAPHQNTHRLHWHTGNLCTTIPLK